MRRVLPASPSVVYDAWLDPEALAEFITRFPTRAGEIDVDSRVGGRFRIDMIDSDSVVHIVGEYLELDRPGRLRFTWTSTLGGGFDSIVTVTLEPEGDDRTVMTIEHAQLPHDWVADHEKGWTRIALQLEAKLARR